MNKLTLQQVHTLRKAQEELNDCKASYLKFYPKLAKHIYTADLNNLIRSEFSRLDVQLNIPKLPARSAQEEYTPLLQVDRMIELYDATVEGSSLL
ncbi:uncharacterized protein LOC116805990 [Drosophila grimshawi]|uniref:uncharacterized protein LOC116805990 n=1 Tax=Drosophila grimshawi TaxID=7222 RepID=UPI000C86F7E8|nr:uncharacterized protein LOC116805990 [Drosophila grimshawi]